MVLGIVFLGCRLVKQNLTDGCAHFRIREVRVFLLSLSLSLSLINVSLTDNLDTYATKFRLVSILCAGIQIAGSPNSTRVDAASFRIFGYKWAYEWYVVYFASRYHHQGVKSAG